MSYYVLRPKNELRQYPIHFSSLTKNLLKMCSSGNNLLVLKDVKHGEIDSYICFGTLGGRFLTSVQV